MSIEGQDANPTEVTTGLPAPPSLRLFAIYIADIH